MLREIGADILICGGIGGGAMKSPSGGGASACTPESAETRTRAVGFPAGRHTLVQNAEATCDHHDHGGDCGHHGRERHGEGCGPP